MRRYRWAVFLALSTLTMLGLLYMQYYSDQQKEKFEHLTRQIDDLKEIYESTVQELSKVNEENRTLIRDLNEAIERIEAVEQRNSELETILFNQRQTYQNAVSMRGSTMPVLTMSSFTAKQYERAWSRLGAHGLKGTGQFLVQAEELYNVNSLVLSAIAYLESAGGMSKLAREKNNLFGLGAGGSTLPKCSFSPLKRMHLLCRMAKLTQPLFEPEFPQLPETTSGGNRPPCCWIPSGLKKWADHPRSFGSIYSRRQVTSTVPCHLIPFLCIFANFALARVIIPVLRPPLYPDSFF